MAPERKSDWLIMASRWPSLKTLLPPPQPSPPEPGSSGPLPKPRQALAHPLHPPLAPQISPRLPGSAREQEEENTVHSYDFYLMNMPKLSDIRKFFLAERLIFDQCYVGYYPGMIYLFTFNDSNNIECPMKLAEYHYGKFSLASLALVKCIQQREVTTKAVFVCTKINSFQYSGQDFVQLFKGTDSMFTLEFEKLLWLFCEMEHAIQMTVSSSFEIFGAFQKVVKFLHSKDFATSSVFLNGLNDLTEERYKELPVDSKYYKSIYAYLPSIKASITLHHCGSLLEKHLAK